MRCASWSWTQWLILAAILIAGVGLLLPSTQRVRWVGSTDLEIEFVVTDALTQEPINGATVDVHSDGGFCAEREKDRFALVTDGDGSVKRLLKGCMCFGTSGWNIDTFVVHLPWWFYQVSADGYSVAAWTELDIPANVRKVQRGSPAARLVMSIKLDKKDAEPNAALDRGGR